MLSVGIQSWCQPKDEARGSIGSVKGGGCAGLLSGNLIVLWSHTGSETHSARLRAGGSAGCSFGCVEGERQKDSCQASGGMERGMFTHTQQGEGWWGNRYQEWDGCAAAAF